MSWKFQRQISILQDKNIQISATDCNDFRVKFLLLNNACTEKKNPIMPLHIIADWKHSVEKSILWQQYSHSKRNRLRNFPSPFFESPLAQRTKPSCKKKPRKESKTYKMQKDMLASLPLRICFFLLHTLILRLLGSLCEMLCAYKKA